MLNHSDIQISDCGRIGIYYLKLIWSNYQPIGLESQTEWI